MTLRFKWFLQYEVHPLTEAITKKFTMKMVIERKPLKSQNPNTLKSYSRTNENN